MNITFRQLRLFQALAELGSVSAAARALHVTQPTASMQLKEISNAVGLPLYELVGRRIHLTEVGKSLAATARQMSHSWDAFAQEVDGLKGLSRGRLRLAVVSTAESFMPRLIGAFCKKHPDIELSLEILNRDGVVHRLAQNLDDLYIMSMPPAHLDLMDEVFMPNPLVVIASTHEPLARQGRLGLHALAGRPFILREPGSGTRMAVDQHFRRHKFKADIRLELGSNEAVKESVAGGLGLGVVSSHALHGHDKENGVRILDVEGFPLPSVWHIVHPSGKKLSPAAHAFKRHVFDDIARRRAKARPARHPA